MAKCVGCGKETNFMPLQNDKWGCEECMNQIGVEQNNIKNLIENNLNLKDIEEINIFLDNAIELIKFCYEETSISTIQHLLDSLKATQMIFDESKIDKETKEKIQELLDKIG